MICLVKNMPLFLTIFKMFNLLHFFNSLNLQNDLVKTYWKNVVQVCACYVCVCVQLYTHTHICTSWKVLLDSHPPPLSLKEICRMWWANCSLVFFYRFLEIIITSGTAEWWRGLYQSTEEHTFACTQNLRYVWNVESGSASEQPFPDMFSPTNSKVMLTNPWLDEVKSQNTEAIEIWIGLRERTEICQFYTKIAAKSWYLRHFRHKELWNLESYRIWSIISI